MTKQELKECVETILLSIVERVSAGMSVDIEKEAKCIVGYFPEQQVYTSPTPMPIAPWYTTTDSDIDAGK